MDDKFKRLPTDPVYVPEIGPPQGDRPCPKIYELIGEENIFRLIEDFYQELGRSEIRGMFPEDLKEASKKSAAFFVFLFGGPPLFHERYGPPMMRKRHLPFRIGYEQRKVWLACFKTVLNDPKKYSFPEDQLESFFDFLDGFSEWMVNTGPTP